MADDGTVRLTPEQIADQLRGATRVAPGIWIDRHGHTHISIVELLTQFDLPDTPETRGAVERIANEILMRLQPDATIVRQEAANG